MKNADEVIREHWAPRFSRVSTHYVDCWKNHAECALLLALDLAKEWREDAESSR